MSEYGEPNEREIEYNSGSREVQNFCLFTFTIYKTLSFSISRLFLQACAPFARLVRNPPVIQKKKFLEDKCSNFHIDADGTFVAAGRKVRGSVYHMVDDFSFGQGWLSLADYHFMVTKRKNFVIFDLFVIEATWLFHKMLQIVLCNPLQWTSLKWTENILGFFHFMALSHVLEKGCRVNELVTLGLDYFKVMKTFPLDKFCQAFRYVGPWSVLGLICRQMASASRGSFQARWFHAYGAKGTGMLTFHGAKYQGWQMLTSLLKMTQRKSIPTSSLTRSVQ